uniref:UvrD-like helicase ATP-binding domain-containing protein n=1 Tax=Chenopodium quinoa TaxID=63459 RepID=A0A803KZ79_CHEQI
MVEVAILMNIVQRLHKEWCYSQKISVCIVSQYAAQVKEIERRIGKRYGKLLNFELKVKSVEGFQDEADIVIVSTVRSNSAGSSEFSLDYRITNVASSKARHCLWILGNMETLAEANNVWKDIIAEAKQHKCCFNAEVDETLAKVMVDVKSKLDELEDLLDKDNNIFKASRWKVVFSENFVKSFAKLHSIYSKKLVVNFLLKLANGWRPNKKNTDVVCESSVKIAKQFEVEGRYIICTNDIIRVQGYATQILKVWDILHLVDIPALVSKLDIIYGAFSDDFLIRCKEKCLQGKLELPRHFTSFDVERYKVVNSSKSTSALDADRSGTSFIENAKVKESLLLMKFYPFFAGVLSHLMSASDALALNVPFEVSDQEREVILNGKSTFILGRSGTGKTTVLVMKLFQNEQQHHIVSEGNVHEALMISGFSTNAPGKIGTSLRQLFVTVNPKLCFAVKHQINNLTSFVHGENFGEGCIFNDVNEMDEYEMFKDVPESFEDIPSNVFPLVITFNMFLLMLDRSFGLSYFDRFPDVRKIYYMETASFRLVVQALTRKLDPLRVFTEINSCIKGRLHYGEGDNNNLSLQSYMQLSKSRVSKFSEDERELIYKIFEDYEKKKVVRGEYDLADLVNDLLCRFKCENYEGELMDFVYIDEVQDLTMKQLALFKYICSNVEEGFVFAGDTAQTIAKGIDFRFEDIRNLFYEEFLNNKIEGVGEERKRIKGLISPTFQLSQNFRTHAGVLNLAQSIVDLIYYFFPNSIDPLNQETSLLCGELPILLDCASCEDSLMRIFQDKAGQGDNSNSISFGSEQVIMVRDDYARDKLGKFVGRQALVLTIFECKGLEFEDVLLYNFFGSSPLGEQWRIIYEYMEEKLCTLNPETYPSFTNAKHDVLCYELKQLYVTITRTRQRLWICEDNDSFLSPMADYWQKLNLIQVKKLDESFARSMQVASSLEDWRWRGKKMLEVQNYKAATQCFKRAGDFYWQKFAKASGFKAAADNLRGLNVEKSLELLREAAELFESIRNIKKAVECYIDAEDYEKAGKLCLEESDLQRAGECFTLAGCYKLAAEVYDEGLYFNECLYTCSEGKLYDLGLCYIQSWKQKYHSKPAKQRIDFNASEQKFLRKCALAFFEQQDKQTMMKYVRDFSSLESMRTFLKKLGCFAELHELELEYVNLVEAAKCARQMGNILLEADMLVKAGDCEEASRLYLAFAFAGSLWADGSKGWALKEFPSKKGLLFKARAQARNCPRHFNEVCENIKFISSDKVDLHELQKQLALSRQHKNLRGEILSTRRILDRLLATDVSMHESRRNTIKKSLNWISVTKLIHHWNDWKHQIETIFKYLDSLTEQGTSGFQEYENFCLEYLGVRKRSISPDADYFLLYPDAEWVKYVPRRSDKMESIDANQLVYAAKRHWCAEIFSVGLKYLELIESFRILAVENSMSMYRISQTLIHIFEAAQLLIIQSRYLKQANDVLPSLMNSIDHSAEAYFLHFFSLDWGNKIFMGSKDLAMQSNTSRNLLKKAILKKFMVEVDGVDEALLTLSQVSQVAVILFGSNWKNNEKYEGVQSKIKSNSPWSSLIKNLVIGTVPQTSDDYLQLAWNLCDALMQAYDSKSNMSPSCFVYLLERLLVLVSCFDGCLFATRSSVTEWLVHLNWSVSKEPFTLSVAGLSSSVEPIYDFMAYTIHELLLNKQGIEEWIEKAGFNVKQFLPMLILKLLVLMCLICLNSGKYLERLNDVINRSDTISFLPESFRKVFFQREGCSFCNVIAEALKRIDDPLVIIRNPDVCPYVYARHTIFLNVFNKNMDSILETLFPSRQKSSYAHR